MKSQVHRRIQFVSDGLVQQIVEGRKTASVVHVGEVDVADGVYDDPLVVGETYDVYDSSLAGESNDPHCGHGVMSMGRHPRTSVAR